MLKVQLVVFYFDTTDEIGRVNRSAIDIDPLVADMIWLLSGF